MKLISKINLKERYFFSSIYLYISLFLFFFSRLIFFFFDFKIDNILYLNILFLLILGLLQKKRFKKGIFIFVLIYLSIITFGIINGVFNKVSIKIVLSQTLYYFKPLIFFFFGYFFVKKKQFLLLVKWVLIYSLIGTIFFYLNRSFYIEAIISKFSVYGENISIETLRIWNPETGFVIYRNPTLLFHVLDSGFILFFISSFYFLQNRNKNYSLIFVATIILISTLTRSAVLAFFTMLIIFYYFRLSLLKRIVLVIFIGVFVFTLYMHFSKQIEFLFIKQGSAKIHLENLINAIKHIQKHPLGTGIGTSGWKGDINNILYLYSEGSILTTIIENGMQFLIIYILIGIYFFYNSRNQLFPIYCGYLVASMLIPIGFSTLFNLLFFVYASILEKENGKESLYNNCKLEFCGTHN